MTRTVLALIVLGCIVFIGAGISKYLDGRTIDALEVAADSLRLRIFATDLRLDIYTIDSARFVATRDRFNVRMAALRADLRSAEGRTRVVTVSRDSARAMIDLDTLTPQVRDMIVLEREVAVACCRERDIVARRVRNLEARSVIDSTELAQLGALIRAVRAERDGAMTIIMGHETRLEFNFFRNLFEDLPRKAACAAGGAIVAELNDGQVLVGAVVALGICLAAGGIF